MVWGYSLAWFLVNDRVKLLAYRIFDPVKKAGAKPEAKAEAKAKDSLRFDAADRHTGVRTVRTAGPSGRPISSGLGTGGARDSER